MEFSFYSAGKIIFGKGAFAKIGALASELGRNALVVTAGEIIRKNGITDIIEKRLREANVSCTLYEGAIREPDIPQVEPGVETGRKRQCDCIIAIGGGSTLDTGKAIAGLMPNPKRLRDYLGVEGKAESIEKPALPWIAVPTTAGTGSEVTSNAVINIPELGIKKSFRHPDLLARTALIDPELSVHVPPAQTAASGMDALTQLIESYVTRYHQPMTDALAIEGIRHVGPHILRAYRNGFDIEAREHLILASLLSGLALSNSRLGAVHGFAASFGGKYPVPHGLACAIALPYVMKKNMQSVPERYAAVGEALTGKRYSHPDEAAAAGLEYVRNLNDALGIPGTFGAFGIPQTAIPALVEGSRGNSMSGNPVELSDEELAALVRMMI